MSDMVNTIIESTIKTGVQIGDALKSVEKKDLYKRETGIRIHCKQCGYKYFISDANLAWYKTQGLEEPKRCYKCRSKNKTTKEGQSEN